MPVSVEASKREERGKNASRRLRTEGRIPGVVYGQGEESVALSLDPQDILRILRSHSGRNTVIELSVGDGAKENVVIRDYQLDPIRNILIHTDFQRIAMDEVMEFNVPVELEGTPEGVKEGGVLEFIMRQIAVECLPGDVPESFVINVSHLDMGGDPVTVADLEVDRDKVTILDDEDQAIATVAAPTMVASETEEEEEELLEPELIGAEGEEGEEGAEGEEGEEEASEEGGD
ncbi:MAG TPA: 50S ribosomal protein L25 [Acidobacteriota bacterium]|nr:50S ribosomal protein L25 [Acidobacteriota bacterium]